LSDALWAIAVVSKTFRLPFLNCRLFHRGSDFAWIAPKLLLMKNASAAIAAVAADVMVNSAPLVDRRIHYLFFRCLQRGELFNHLALAGH
jgi:hypothetical protein